MHVQMTCHRKRRPPVQPHVRMTKDERGFLGRPCQRAGKRARKHETVVKTT